MKAQEPKGENLGEPMEGDPLDLAFPTPKAPCSFYGIYMGLKG